MGTQSLHTNESQSWRKSNTNNHFLVTLVEMSLSPKAWSQKIQMTNPSSECLCSFTLFSYFLFFPIFFLVELKKTSNARKIQASESDHTWKMKTQNNNSHRYNAATNWHKEKCKAKSPRDCKSRREREEKKNSAGNKVDVFVLGSETLRKWTIKKTLFVTIQSDIYINRRR